MGFSGIRVFVVAFYLLSSVSFANGGTEPGAAPGTVRSRDRGNCAILISEKETDDTNGVPVAPLDLDRFREFLATSPKIEGAVILSGVPMTRSKRIAFEAGARALLDEYGLAETPMTVITEPDKNVPLLQRLWQRLVYFFPRRSDWQKPVLSEVLQGFGIAAGANVSIAIFTFASFPAAIAVPIVATNSGLDFIVGTLRRTQNNWTNRSDEAPIEMFVKNALVSGMFITGVYTAQRWPSAWETLSTGPLSQVMTAASGNMGQFLQTQGPTVLANGLLFTILFKGLYEWTRRKEATPEGNSISRKYFGWIMGTMFTVTGPLYLGAITSKDVILDLGVMQFNPYHAALGILTLAGVYLWRFPEKFDKAIPVVDYVARPVVNAVSYPFRLIARGFRALLGIEKGPALPPESR